MGRIRRIFKNILNWFVNFYKAIWRLIKSMKTFKGLISLFIGFMIVIGWCFVFLGIGIATKNQWFINIGSVVIAFWVNPLCSPTFGSILTIAYFCQRYILKDSKALTFKKLKEIFFEKVEKQN